MNIFLSISFNISFGCSNDMVLVWQSKDDSYSVGDHFLAHQIRNSDILYRVRNSYLTHVILLRLSLEDCSLAVLELPHMVVK